MDSSKEDLIEMTELKSPVKRLPRLRLKKSNQIHSPLCVSPARSSNRDITSLFSVKRASNPEDNATETISELSDDLLSDSSLRNLSKTESKASSMRSTSERLNKLRKSLDIIKQESSQVDAHIKSIRNKFQLSEKRNDRPELSFFKFEKDVPEDVEKDFDSKQLVQYSLPEYLKFSINLAEADNFSGVKKLIAQNTAIPFTYNKAVKPQIFIQKGDCTMYYPPRQLINNLEEVIVIENNILELSLYHLQFLHHPLFSLEHVLQEQLKEVFDHYSENLERKNLEAWKKELSEAKSAHFSVKEMRKLRENVFREGKKQRENLKLILNIWRGIKKLRALQKFSSTSIRLMIKKEKSDTSLEHEQYDSFFREMLTDILEERRAAYKRKLKEYNKKLKAKEETVDKESEESEKEQNGLERPTLDINRRKIESDLKEKFDESFRPPGEPSLIICLKNDHNISESVNNNQENDRRAVTSTTKFLVRILCENIPVCKSKLCTLDDQFTLDFNELFTIQLTNIPKCLVLEFFEHPKGLLKKKIAELTVDIPNLTVLYKDTELVQSHFERREIVHYKHAGVGSGYNLKKLLEDIELPLEAKADFLEIGLHTKGVLYHRIGWQTSQSSLSLAESELQIPRLIDKWGAVDEAQMLKYLEGVDEFLEKEKENNYFRLNPYAGKLIFCKAEALQRNIRLQYLKLRDQNEIEFDGVTIPNRIREIPFALLRDFKKRKTLEAVQDEESDEDPDSLRESGKRRLAQVHTRVFHTCKGLSNNLSYESVVDEKYLIYFEDLIRISLRNVLNWFRWKPKLTKPLPRLENKAPQLQEPLNKILIQILSAKNIPKRKGGGPVTRPFLEISYEDFFTKTSVVEGCDSVWNEVVELPLQCQHADYLNPASLKGSISIDVFDCIDEEGGKFWLGEVQIPVAALTTGLNLSGWFKVRQPVMHLGYEGKEEQYVTKSPKHVNQELTSQDTYLQLDVSISPSVPSLEPNMEDLPSNDIPYIRDHIIKWNATFNSTFPQKKFNALALDVQGRTTCITRYVRPLEPPQLNNEEFDVTPEQCLRYVSLIPFTECNRFYQNVWLTSDQLLSFMIGSVIDHCVTLTCFLLALKLEAYLLLGYGIPHGATSYVLLCEYSRDSDLPNYYIFDVIYNEIYSLADSFCPLQRVYCLVGQENVWGNAQKTQNLMFLRFDLARRSDWWPLFNGGLSAPTNFINNKVNFATNRDFEDLERQLERKLKRKFSKWRPMERTTFNHRVSGLFKSALRLFEMNFMYGRSNSEALVEVNKATSQYDVIGTILNMPFSNLNSVVKKIKRLNIHVQQRGVTDFGLSVFIQSYPGQVLSVWVFIGRVFDKTIN